jgi:protein involved in polysaccharide export with SLBB domain
MSNLGSSPYGVLQFEKPSTFLRLRSFPAVLLLLVGCLIVPRNCFSQVSDQSGSQSTYSQQQQGQTQDQQTGQSTNRQTGQSTDQQTGEQGQQGNQLQGQLPDQQSDQSTDQQMGFSMDQTPPSAEQQRMSAEQIIDILRQEPDILSSIKALAAQQTGVDPGTITDPMIYDQIRQDPVLRDTASRELVRRGFSVNTEVDPMDLQNSTPSASAATRRLTGPQAKRPYTTQTRPLKPEEPQARPYENPDAPQARHQRGPYRNIPSLQDLYSQFPVTEKKLRRFGSETFLLGTGNASQLPVDVPVGPEYVLGSGDSLVVNIWGGQSSRLDRPIDRQGQIALPEVGTITIAGLTIAQAQTAIQKALNTQFQNEHVEISLGRVRTVRVYVVGDVQRPGAYDVSSLSTPLNALYAAGGPTNTGSLRILRQMRGAQMVAEIDLYDFLLHGMRSQPDRLQPGDTFLVPPIGAQVSVAGMVRRPAIYELKDEQSLDQILQLAGGVLASANLKQIRVERIEAHQSRTMLSLQIPANGAETAKDVTGFKVRDGDSVMVSQIEPYNEQMVYLDGHVFRPGKYPYREGMTVNDLLHSYQDVMPEPADHAELVRLQPPDFRPLTIGFNLPDVLMGNDAIPLKPFDLIRVYSRYEIDSPKVLIDGEVLRPGEYPLSHGMTITALLQMAGGFKRSAYQKEADVTSYAVQDGQKVLLNHSTVDIVRALDGDKKEDVALKPGDMVSIRQLTGWQDIGATVKVSGEVGHAGTYGIESGERLSSVLRRAGGFRGDAFPEGAVFERVQVRELGEKARQEMIRRIETTPINFKPGLLSGQDQAEMYQASEQQRDQVLTALRNHPASGRLVIRIGADINQWANTSDDVEMRPGDTLLIPKLENLVLVSGQVYNQTAISYVPDKDGSWYLRQVGGATPSGDKGKMFVVRANGSVVGHSGSWASRNSLSVRMRPGDTIVVPEKTIGSQVWKNVISAAQIMSSVAITGAVAGIF